MNNIENAIYILKEELADGTDLYLTFATAIAALEKQIPKKPNKFDGYQCQICCGKLARQTDLVNQKHCHYCGQKLDWSVEE